MSGFVLWQRLRPPPCTGGVTVELRPPLRAPGPYRFHVELEGIRQPCELEVPFPITGRVDTKACGHAVELRTRVRNGEAEIVGLTIGASPDTLRFRATRNGEVLYDTAIEPKYGPYETPREESRVFCGKRALVAPVCRRGSSACAPYEPTCDGPEDCGDGKTCCANPDFGREYGELAATECGSRRRCLDHFGSIACHTDADCPTDMSCTDQSVSKDFKRPVVTCEPRKTATHTTP
jgi:hypothetical protein